MDIKREQFAKGLALCSSNTKSQIAWLESIGFDFNDELNDYFGMFISNEDINLEIEDQTHIHVLQDHDVIDDARVSELEDGAPPTIKEIKCFVQLQLDWMSGSETAPWIIWGLLKCGEDRLYVMAYKIGPTFDSLDSDFIGIFKSLDEASKTAFADGTLRRG